MAGRWDVVVEEEVVLRGGAVKEPRLKGRLDVGVPDEGSVVVDEGSVMDENGDSVVGGVDERSLGVGEAVATRGRGAGGRGNASSCASGGGVGKCSSPKSNLSGGRSVDPSWQKRRSRRSEDTSAQ